MKNFVIVCAFALCTFVFANVANAQSCGDKKSNAGCCKKSKTEASVNNPDAKTVSTTDKKDKKCCSKDKANANAKKKDCCASKKEARKEENK